MTRLNTIKGLTIYQLGDKDKERLNTTSEYVCFTKDEMDYPIQLRNIEWEEDNLESMKEFCKNH